MINGSSGLNNIHTATVKTPLIRATLKSNSFIGGDQSLEGGVFNRSIVSLYNDGYLYLTYSNSVSTDLGVFDAGGSALKPPNSFSGNFEASSDLYGIGRTLSWFHLDNFLGDSRSVIVRGNYSPGATFVGGGTDIYIQAAANPNYSNALVRISLLGLSSMYVVTGGLTNSGAYPTTTIKYLELGSTPVYVWSNNTGVTTSSTPLSGGDWGLPGTTTLRTNYSIGKIQAFTNGVRTYLLMERDPQVSYGTDGNLYILSQYKKITMMELNKANVFWQRDIYNSDNDEETARLVNGGDGSSYFLFGIEKIYQDKSLLSLGNTSTWIINDTISSFTLYKSTYEGTLFQRYFNTGGTFTASIVPNGSTNNVESYSVIVHDGVWAIRRNIFDEYGSSTDITNDISSYSNTGNEAISIDLGNKS